MHNAVFKFYSDGLYCAGCFFTAVSWPNTTSKVGQEVRGPGGGSTVFVFCQGVCVCGGGGGEW